jgi:alpha-galactosidase
MKVGSEAQVHQPKAWACEDGKWVSLFSALVTETQANPPILIMKHYLFLKTYRALALASLMLPLGAQSIPAELPDPDGEAGDATKPVKVYILAGQSNMVGMGELGGAKNLYNGIFLTSDPAVPTGPFMIYKVGSYLVKPLAVFKPDGGKATEAIAKGSIQVDKKGIYQVHCGGEGGSKAVMQLNGKEVYRRDGDAAPTKVDVELAAGEKYEFTISDFDGEAPRFWLRKMDLLGNGDLESVAKREGMFPWLVDDKGEWTVRNDVYFQEARVAPEGKGSPLTATSSGKTIGPELGFGHVMGNFHDEQVLLIKTAMGNRALGFDFRPPSSGRSDPDSEWESLEYRLMVEGVRKTLANIEAVVPGYKGQGYEIAGFAWFQGHKDSGTPESIAAYEGHLVNLIKDVRKEFGLPNLPAVVATVGFGGERMADKYFKILEAQMAVSDPKKHPEFEGTVSSVDTRPFWREVDESPTNQDYHYNRNAETYVRIGDAMGRAMVRLQRGKAEALPQPARPKLPPVAEGEMTEEQKAAIGEALAPIILGGVIPSYCADPRFQKQLIQEATGARPERANQFLQAAVYGLVNSYKMAGVDDYDWKVFGPDLRDQEWEYFSFDPKEDMPKDKAPRYRKVTWPEGMENWTATDFDASAWKKGLPPFGQKAGKLEPLRGCSRDSGCGCGEAPRTLWENEVLMTRGTFELPAPKEGHRYRIVVGGSNHVKTGDGYAIYVNGKLLAESKQGVPNRQGGQPRGGHVYADMVDEFKGGEVTIAVLSFLQYNSPAGSPQGHLTVWVEEQKIPSVLLSLAETSE